ncbi:MAG: 23S rRNA (guanosine(2251)-2'-O)-methyltransferase RlmB [Synergistaceae bacterium]|jgi:23S rRNA (guanosine2251-2'-O)-methyltransferase|nr:23S rRNA (guanosine(2251)-2'-O)-methyltransferase RlmB [Synergistaceae bacterium]
MEDFCWGRNPVIKLLEDEPALCLKVMASKTMQRTTLDHIAGLCRAAGIPLQRVEPKALNSMIEGVNHQGVVAVIAAKPMMNIADALDLLPKPPSRALAVLLDHVQDPHNLGAMIRSAEAASASFLALPLRRSSLPTGTVVKTSAGASMRLPLASVGNTASTVREFQEAGLWTVALDSGAKRSIYGAALPARTLLVVGSEGKGVGRTTASACDETLSIPIAGEVGSLNASVALAVAMFEWFRLNCTGS